MAEVATVEELVVDEVDCLAVVVPDPAVVVLEVVALLVVVPVPGMH